MDCLPRVLCNIVTQIKHKSTDFLLFHYYYYCCFCSSRRFVRELTKFPIKRKDPESYVILFHCYWVWRSGWRLRTYQCQQLFIMSTISKLYCMKEWLCVCVCFVWGARGVRRKAKLQQSASLRELVWFWTKPGIYRFDLTQTDDDDEMK